MSTLGNDDRKSRNLQKFLQERPAPTVRRAVLRDRKQNKRRAGPKVAKAVNEYNERLCNLRPLSRRTSRRVSRRNSSRVAVRNSSFKQSKRCYVPSNKYQDMSNVVVVKPLNAKRVRFTLEVHQGENGAEDVKDVCRTGKLSKMLGVRERKVTNILHAAHMKSVEARRLIQEQMELERAAVKAMAEEEASAAASLESVSEV